MNINYIEDLLEKFSTKDSSKECKKIENIPLEKSTKNIERTEKEKIEKGQRGKKKCPVCIVLKPVRLSTCDVCGYVFKKKKDDEVDKSLEIKNEDTEDVKNVTLVTKITFIRGIFVTNLVSRKAGEKLIVRLSAINKNHFRREVFDLSLRDRSKENYIFYTNLYRRYLIEIIDDYVKEEEVDKFLQQNFNLDFQPEFVVQILRDKFSIKTIEWRWLEEENKLECFKTPVSSKTLIRKNFGSY